VLKFEKKVRRQKVDPDYVENDIELGTLLLKCLSHYSLGERSKLQIYRSGLADNAASIRVGASRI
jgi:hypothetical protein